MPNAFEPNDENFFSLFGALLIWLSHSVTCVGDQEGLPRSAVRVNMSPTGVHVDAPMGPPGVHGGVNAVSTYVKVALWVSAGVSAGVNVGVHVGTGAEL